MSLADVRMEMDPTQDVTAIFDVWGNTGTY